MHAVLGYASEDADRGSRTAAAAGEGLRGTRTLPGLRSHYVVCSIIRPSEVNSAHRDVIELWLWFSIAIVHPCYLFSLNLKIFFGSWAISFNPLKLKEMRSGWRLAYGGFRQAVNWSGGSFYLGMDSQLCSIQAGLVIVWLRCYAGFAEAYDWSVLY